MMNTSVATTSLTYVRLFDLLPRATRQYVEQDMHRNLLRLDGLAPPPLVRQVAYCTEAGWVPPPIDIRIIDQRK